MDKTTDIKMDSREDMGLNLMSVFGRGEPSIYVKDDAIALNRVCDRLDKLKKRMSEEDLCRVAAKSLTSAFADKKYAVAEIVDIIRTEFPRFDSEKLSFILEEMFHVSESDPREETDGLNVRSSEVFVAAKIDGSDETIDEVACRKDSIERQKKSSRNNSRKPNGLQSRKHSMKLDVPGLSPEQWIRGKKYVCNVSGMPFEGKNKETATCGYSGKISSLTGDSKGGEWAWYFFGGRAYQREFTVTRNDLERGTFKVLELLS